MEWEEISRRLRNGTSVSVLAELAGTTYKNMYNRIRRREQLDGRQYLKADQLKRPYKAQGGRKKAAGLPEDKKAAAEIVAIMEAVPDGAKVEIRRDRPEVEPIGEEKAPARPEVVEKVADVPEVVKEFAGIPEGVVKDTLEKYKKEQADAVREMHAIETMYKLQKAKEMKLRTVVLALERLLEGGSL